MSNNSQAKMYHAFKIPPISPYYFFSRITFVVLLVYTIFFASLSLVLPHLRSVAVSVVDSIHMDDERTKTRQFYPADIVESFA